MQLNPTYATVLRVAFPQVQFIGSGTTYASLKATGPVPIPSEAELQAAIPIVQAELARRKAIAARIAQYEATLAQGFISDALGTPHKYSTDLSTRINLIGLTVAILLGNTGPFPFQTLTAGPQMHTKDQILQVFSDGLTFLASEYQKMTADIAQI